MNTISTQLIQPSNRIQADRFIRKIQDVGLIEKRSEDTVPDALSGRGTLYEINNTQFILTSAHVVENAGKSNFEIIDRNNKQVNNFRDFNSYILPGDMAILLRKGTELDESLKDQLKQVLPTNAEEVRKSLDKRSVGYWSAIPSPFESDISAKGANQPTYILDINPQRISGTYLSPVRTPERETHWTAISNGQANYHHLYDEAEHLDRNGLNLIGVTFSNGSLPGLSGSGWQSGGTLVGTNNTITTAENGESTPTSRTIQILRQTELQSLDNSPIIQSLQRLYDKNPDFKKEFDTRYSQAINARIKPSEKKFFLETTLAAKLFFAIELGFLITDNAYSVLTDAALDEAKRLT